MALDLVLLVVIVLSAASLLAIIGRKMAIISSVDLKSLPERKATQLKEQLMEQRFARRLQGLWFQVRRLSKPTGMLIQRGYRRLLGRLTQLEQQYTLPGGRGTGDESNAVRISQLLNEARAAVEDGLLPEAEQKCIEAIGLNEREVSAYRMLGDIYRQRKDYSHAREVYEFLLQLNTQDAEAHEGLGRVAIDADELTEAEKEFEKSLALADTAAVHLELADVYEKLGDPAKAVIACQDALSSDPKNPKILDRFLTLAIAAGKPDLARDAYQTLKTVNPDNQKLEEFDQQIRALE